MMQKLQKVYNDLEITGVSRQDIINLEKAYGTIVTNLENVSINMFTGMKSKNNLDITLKMIRKEIDRLDEARLKVNLLTITNKLDLLNTYIIKLKEISKNNKLDKTILKESKLYLHLAYHNEEKEIVSLVDLSTKDAILNHKEVIGSFDDKELNKLVVKYMELENKETTDLNRFDDVILYANSLETNIGNLEETAAYVKREITNLITLPKEDLITWHDKNSHKLNAPLEPANLILIEIGARLLSK